MGNLNNFVLDITLFHFLLYTEISPLLCPIKMNCLKSSKQVTELSTRIVESGLKVWMLKMFISL